MSGNYRVKCAQESPDFQSARPVWIEGLERERNITAGFRAVFQWDGESDITLRVTASSLYRATVNGCFAGCGPARTAHGYLRVDEWNISRHLKTGENIVAIEVVAYNLNSYCHLDQRASLQAEVIACEETVLASTAGQGVPFTARWLQERVRKVQRLSPQRCFIEMYRLRPEFDSWKTDTSQPMPEKVAIQPSWQLLKRGVSYPTFKKLYPTRTLRKGTITPRPMPQERWSPWDDEGQERHGGCARQELEEPFSDNLQTLAPAECVEWDEPLLPNTEVQIDKDAFHLLDFGVNHTGFIILDVWVSAPTRLVLHLDEILTQGDVTGFREGNVNSLCFDLEPGKYDLETIEPYTLRYLKLMAMGGAVKLRCALREYVGHVDECIHFHCDDERLNAVFAAARHTFRQNALDLFMDCPSRERGGYLADSLFAARAAAVFTGSLQLEHNFLENYCLPESFESLPEGMIPMCYPADHKSGKFIPNWSLWFILQLEEFQGRGGDPSLIAGLRHRVMGILNYFQKFENEWGLLESLPGWIFVDWSRANEFVDDVSFATNMLYARALDAAARIYGREEWTVKAQNIRKVIRERGMLDGYFSDHAMRTSEGLVTMSNHSEACQYYAFYFDVAAPHTHPELWHTLKNDFGPGRPSYETHPKIHPSAAFLGTLLRFELLARHGETRQLCEEIIVSLHHMAQQTGTLWEYDTARASCCHGYQAHVAAVLFRHILGIKADDVSRREVTMRFFDVPLHYCSGTMSTKYGPLSLAWLKTDKALIFNYCASEEYQVNLENDSGLPLVEKNEWQKTDRKLWKTLH